MTAPLPIEVLLPGWMNRAMCNGWPTDVFFPGSGGGDLAKEICGTCPVRVDCLDYAEVNDVRYGTWGGLTENERRRRRTPGPPRRRLTVVDSQNDHAGTVEVPEVSEGPW